jgi:hypothetical protein
MDRLNIVHSAKESPLRRQLTEDELLILISRLANPKNHIVAMTAARNLRQRMLQWVQTGELLHKYST